jgi:hypothetical protein
MDGLEAFSQTFNDLRRLGPRAALLLKAMNSSASQGRSQDYTETGHAR